MKKIGIVTHYFKSINYGGILQAYALCKAVQKLGYNAEQIQFEYKSTDHINKFKKLLDIKFLLKIPLIIVERVTKKLRLYKHKNVHALRDNAFRQFRTDYIAHSKRVYNSENIKESLDEYDCFITGSDQVWCPAAYNPIYRLDFVPKGTPKFSYAASIAQRNLTNDQKNIFRDSLIDYIGVSLRERETIGLFEEISPVPPVCSLDPTLLLTKQEWLEVVDNVVINEPYVFCYFLGCNKRQQKLAREYAHNNGMITVVIANPDAKNDDTAFDKVLNGISPPQFLSLIINSSVVFTDSFHATVFSLIFEKKHFVFNRNGKESMNIRIYALSELFNTTNDRFCDTPKKETVEYLEKVSQTVIVIDDIKLQKQKQASLDYLHTRLELAEKMVNNEN